MIKKTTSQVVLLVLMVVSAHAQKFKVATVDFNHLIINYYIYQQAIEEKNVELEDIQKEDAGRQKRIKKLEEEIKLLVTDARDPALADARRQQAMKSAQLRENDLKALLREREVFLTDSERNLAQKMATLRAEINGEVEEAVQKYAASQDVDFVFDETGKSLQEVPFLIYVRNRIDLTDAVLKILNKDAPTPAEEEKKDGQ